MHRAHVIQDSIHINNDSGKGHLRVGSHRTKETSMRFRHGRANNRICLSLILLALLLCLARPRAATQTFPYYWDFENFTPTNQQGWSVDNGMWQVGTPTAGPGGAYDGKQCAGTALTSGTYPTWTDSRLISPALVLPAVGGGQSLMLGFWQWFQLGGGGCCSFGPSTGDVEVSTSGRNGPWTQLSRTIYAVSGGWSYSTVDLSAYAGQQIWVAFHLIATGNTGAGWYVDDVSVSNIPDMVFNQTVTFEDFTQANWQGWSADNGAWQAGKPASGPGAAYDGTQCVFAAEYPLWTDSRLISPPVTLPAAPSGQSVLLDFWQWFQLGGGGCCSFGPSSGDVEVSVWNGSAWGGWTTVSGNFENASGGWSLCTEDLSAYAGQRIMIGFHLNATGNSGAGWYIDDVTVVSPSAGSAAVVGLTSSSNPAAPGQPITFTAAVSALAPGSGAPTGTVTFLDGTSTPASRLGSTTLKNGVATFSTLALASGFHVITASYSGDNNFESTAASLNEDVLQAASVGLTSSAPSSPFNSSVTFTGTVSPMTGSGTPTGTVTFLDGTTALGSETLSNGQATFSTSSLSIGSHTITVSYLGDSSFGAVTSPPLTQNIISATSPVILSSSSNPSTYEQSVKFTATVSAVAPATGTPTGTVTFLDGTTTLGTGTLSNGAAVLSTAALTTGIHTITASYSGDSSFAAATSSPFTQIVLNSASASVTSFPRPGIVGQAVTFTATISAVTGAGTPTGSVTFLDGTTVLGAQTLSDGTAILSTTGLSSGTHVIAVSYPGDGSFAPAISPPLSQLVLKGSAIALASSKNPANAGASVTFTAAVVPLAPATGTPTGTVTFTYGKSSSTISLSNGVATLSSTTLPSGSDTITASYSGDSSFAAAASAPLTQVILNPVSVALTSSATPLPVGQPVTFTATVAPVAPATGSPTGSVTFLDGTTALAAGSVALGANGQATYTTSTLTAGSHSMTAVYSGDNSFEPITSTALTQVVLNPTSVALVSSQSPAAVGKPVTFTATVTPAPPATGTPTGTVTFLDGTPKLATQNLSKGVATYATSTLTAGSHSIMAAYSGDNSFQASSSAAVTQVIQGAVVTVATSKNPSVSGQPVTFTATATSVPSTLGTPTGTVTFEDGTTVLGSGTLSNGATTFSTSSLAVGSHSITAVYSGDASFTGVTSAALTQAVNKGSSGAALVLSPNPSVYGQAVTLVATVSAVAPAAGTPTGTVTVLDGTTPLETLNLVNGVTGFSTKSLTVGSHSITAVYSGDGSFTGVTSKAVTQVVLDGASVTLTTSQSPSAAGQSITFTANVSAVAPATGSPTGTVTFLDGTTVLGSGTVSSGAASFSTSALAVGSHSITAAYSGDSSFQGVTSTAVTQNVLNGAAVALIPSVNSVVIGQPVTFTATVTATMPATGTPTGTVTFTNGGVTMGVESLVKGVASISTTPSASGSYPITAVYSGDSSFAPATSKTLTEVVSPDTASVALESSVNPSVVGQPVTFTATVTAAAPATGTPTGTVTFTNGTSTIGTEPLVNGMASISTAPAVVGSSSITASYSGDNNFKPTSSPVLTQVVLYGALAALTTSSNPSSFNSSVTLTATVTAVAPATGTPTGKVTFMDGTTNLGSGTLANGVATLTTSTLSVGSHTVTAVYSGDNSFEATTSKPVTQVVLKAVSMALTSSQNPSVAGLAVSFVATVTAAAPATGTPTGTVTFKDGTTTLGVLSLVNGVAGFSTSSLASGSQTITVAYSGDSTFGSAQATLTQIVSNLWLPTDVSVGADDLARVLWSNPDGRALLWSIDRTSGNYTQGPIFGPYDGGVWHATKIASGADGVSHILWNKGDGTLSLWWVNANNTLQKSMVYGPFNGWTATDIAVGNDKLIRILWTCTDGRAVVWSVDANGNASNNTNFYGPYAGYTAVALACGSDGLTRLVWANPLGFASLWIMNEANVQESFTLFGPYTGWIPTDLDVGSDDLARLLWTNVNDGRAVVWSVDKSGSPTNNTNFYGPYAGYSATHVACGSDGYTRLMWLNGNAVMSFWHMSSENTMLTFNIYGPYF